jgi:ribose/xylose/arabinose/galactoside ABC-type transport system permease subunit
MRDVRLTRLLVPRLSSVVAGLVLLAIVVNVPAFRRADYWLALSHQYFATAALALALTPIVITGGIDLSVGSAAVLTSVVIGTLAQDAGWPIEWAVLGGLVAGLLAGLANGALVVLGVLPLVATLATRELFRGLAFTLIGDKLAGSLPPAVGETWRRPLLGLPLPLYGIGLLFVLTYGAVHHTWVGRMLYAIGDNEQAARFAGLPVRRVKLGLYVWSGFVAGLCGAALVLEYRAPKADAERSLELAAIACVVLGGIRITGGAGNTAGTLLGVVTITALLAGLSNVSPTWRDVITGSLLVAVAVTNEVASRWSARRAVRAA